MSLTYLRSFRIFGMAIFDIVLSLAGMIIVMLLSHHYHYPDLPKDNFVWAAVLTMFPIAIVSHVVLGVNTSLNYRLGLSRKP